MFEKEVKLDFHDLRVKPAVISEISSRSEVNPYYEHSRGEKFLPIFTAPMDTVINSKNWHYFSKNKIHSIIPRGEFQDLYGSENKFKALSLDEFINQYINIDAMDLYFRAQYTNYVLIDMANGHMKKLVDAVKIAKEKFGNKLVLMVGNIANPKTFEEFAKAGADMVRIGIGNGNACFLSGTKVATEQGNKNIEDVLVDDFVLTHDGSFQKVLAKYTFEKNEDLIKINENISTKDHKYFVVHKRFENIINDENLLDFAEYIKAEDLTEDYLLIELEENV